MKKLSDEQIKKEIEKMNKEMEQTCPFCGKITHSSEDVFYTGYHIGTHETYLNHGVIFVDDTKPAGDEHRQTFNMCSQCFHKFLKDFKNKIKYNNQKGK